MWTRSVRADERGFTLVELLIVMVIVGILAGIAIPAFLDQAGKARGAAATSVLASAETTMDTYRADHGTVCGATLAALEEIEPTLAASPTLDVETCPGATIDSYVLTDSSQDGNVSYTLTDDVGVDARSCAPAGQELCQVNGTW